MKAVRISLIIPIIFSLTACNLRPTVTASISNTPSPTEKTTQSPLSSTTMDASPTAIASAAPSETNTPLPSPTSTLLLTPTFIQEPPVITDWETYVFTTGVSIDYPAGWMVELWVYDFVIFLPPASSNIDPNFRVGVYFFHLSTQDREVADPHSWVPNEGGYDVLWEKPISIDSAEGLEFVWGEPDYYEWQLPLSLMAIYYSERYELDIRLSTAFNLQSIELVQTLGFTDTISSTFNVFEHMVQSVRMDR